MFKHPDKAYERREHPSPVFRKHKHQTIGVHHSRRGLTRRGPASITEFMRSVAKEKIDLVQLDAGDGQAGWIRLLARAKNEKGKNVYGNPPIFRGARQ